MTVSQHSDADGDPDAHRLLEQLDTEEKIQLLHQFQPAMPRVGLGEFRTGQEALHGVAWCGVATVFPQPIGLAASWNPALLEAVGAAVGEQVRAFHHGDRPEVGLNPWAPVVDLLRDPRAGRNEEGYSEDPYLTGMLATAYCHGLGDERAGGWRTAPTLKHFLAYNHESHRVTSSAQVRPRLLHEYYLRAFEPAIRSGAAKAVMLSYNLVNGRPCHLSPYLATPLRQWNPALVAVSDAYGPSNLVGEQGYLPDHVTAHAAAVRTGLDSFTDQGADPRFTLETLRTALRRGVLSETELDGAALRLLRMRTRLRSATPAAAECSSSGDPEGRHSVLARRAVVESIVLLRNEETLPLTAHRLGSLAVIGPLSDDVLLDWYSGTLPYRCTPRTAIATHVPRTRHATGHDRVHLRIGGKHPHQGEYELQDWGDGLVVFRAPNRMFLTRKDDGELVADQDQPNGWVVRETFRLIRDRSRWPEQDPLALEHVASGERYPIESLRTLANGVDEAVTLAAGCDAAILITGNHPMVGARETADRTHIDLADRQRRLIRTIAAANPRTVLVLQSGYPYALQEFEGTVPAILWLAHGGQETGRGLADVLFGDVSPAGRLPQTWYDSTDELDRIGPIDRYDIIATGRTYLYQRRTPRYPFGHGLSYTTFDYSDLRIEQSADGVRQVVLDVTNSGTRDGAEVVQVYVRRLSASRVTHPQRKLIGFDKLELEAGETRTTRVILDPLAAFGIWDVRQGRFLVEKGRYAVEAGASSSDIRQQLVLEPDGETLPPRRIASIHRAADFDLASGTQLVPDRPLRGEAVTVEWSANSSWLDFHDLDFRVLSGRTATLATRACGPGRLVVLVGAEQATLAVVELPGEAERISHTHCALSPTITDIRIVLEGSARLAEFWFERSRPI